MRCVELRQSGNTGGQEHVRVFLDVVQDEEDWIARRECGPKNEAVLMRMAAMHKP